MAKASVRARPAPRGARAQSAGLGLLVCRMCGGSLIQTAADSVECSLCHKAMRVYGGIVDFVAGESSTQLDTIDYDKFYSINPEHSAHLYQMIRSAAGALWPASFGNTLEIGCGTGGFSMALLSNTPTAQVVLTDVSVKMLGICKERLERLPNAAGRVVAYATYSGTEGCFHPAAFDTCCGTSVVHHITDVPRLLAQVHRLLSADGRAFFMEPNLLFHTALVRTLADIVADQLGGAAVADLDTSLILNWIAEVNCSIANSGDIQVLAAREDKHYFIAESFISLAAAAGFSRTIALPCGPDPTGAGALDVYMAQCGITSASMDMLRSLWPAAQQQHFAALHERDQSPCYLFWLEKDAQAGPARRVRVLPNAEPAERSTPGAAPWLWLTLVLQRHHDGLKLIVEGWCVAQEAVRALRIEICGATRRLPIWRPRPDVNAAVNADGAFPPLQALCCGIEGTINLTTVIATGTEVEVGVAILPRRGAMFPERRVLLTVDGASVLLN